MSRSLAQRVARAASSLNPEMSPGPPDGPDGVGNLAARADAHAGRMLLWGREAGIAPSRPVRLRLYVEDADSLRRDVGVDPHFVVMEALEIRSGVGSLDERNPLTQTVNGAWLRSLHGSQGPSMGLRELACVMRCCNECLGVSCVANIDDNPVCCCV